MKSEGDNIVVKNPTTDQYEEKRLIRSRAGPEGRQEGGRGMGGAEAIQKQFKSTE